MIVLAFPRGRGYRIDMSSDQSQVKLFFAKIAADSLYKKETPQQWVDRLADLKKSFDDEVARQLAAAEESLK